MPTAKQGYYVDGKRVPGVTTVIGKGLGGYSKDGLMAWAWKEGKEGRDYRETRDKAAHAGTIAHLCIESHLMGKSLDLRPYSGEALDQGLTAFGAFKEWHGAHEIDVVKQEVQLVDDELLFGGCFDALIYLDGVLTLADWKSSGDIYGTMAVQIGAYHRLITANLHERYHPNQAVIVRVGKDGTLRVVALNAEQVAFGWEMFQVALKVYQAERALNAMVADPNPKPKQIAPTMTLPTVTAVSTERVA